MSELQQSIPPPPRRSPVRRLLRWSFQLLLVALAAWLSARLLENVGWRALVARLRTVDAALALLAVALLVARFVVWDLRWRLAMRRLGDLPGALHSFFTLLGAVCANTLMPTARVIGGLLRARYTSRPGEHTFGRVYGVVLFDQLAHQTVMVITGWLAFAGMALLLGLPWLALGAVVALLVAAGVVGTGLVRWARGGDDRVSAFLTARAARLAAGRRIQSVVVHGRDAVGVVRQLLGDAELRRGALLLGVVFVLLNSLAQWLLFRAMAHPVDLLTVLVAVTLGTAAGAFSGTPGGIGTTEAGMVLAYVALEVPKVEAGAGTLLYRGLHYLVIVALGLPALLVFEARLRRRRREEAQP
jgi:uncharacterized protein (TIRG00374 family)